MKSIEEAAREFADKRQTAQGRKETGSYPPAAWFKAGVTFAQEWVSVEDELPEDETPVLTKIEFLDANDEKVMEDETLYSVAGYSRTIQQWIKEIHYYFPDEEYKPTHWRPIERK